MQNIFVGTNCAEGDFCVNNCAITKYLFGFFCSFCRVQMSVLPVIPDPKYPFADLFNDHNGNLQVKITLAEL